MDINENGNEYAIVVEGLNFNYPDGTPALRDINLKVKKNETLGILGSNGAGKSTLALHFNGILSGSGKVTVMGREINRKNLQKIRSMVGLLFQDPDDQLFSPTVREDVGFGPLNQRRPPEEVEEAVRSALARVGMDGSEDRSPHHMSFGEKKRIALATILSMNPEILVLDEPVSNLDPRGKREFTEFISTLTATKILITHNLEMARRICDRVVIMNCGKIVSDGNVITLDDRKLLLSNGLL